jgi:hypothetical protein
LSGIIIFFLLFLHDSGGAKILIPGRLFDGLVYVVWAAPFVGLFQIYYCYFIQRQRESHAKSVRRMTAGCIGAALVLSGAWFVLPYCRS